MKRGKPLERRTPLKVRKQLQNTPLKAARQMLRRTPLKQVSARRQAENKVRRQVVAAMYAAQPWCGRCGRTDVALAGHEKLGRAQGGDPTRPDILLCDFCNTWCEDFPVEAAAAGWKISRKYPRHG